MTIAIKILIAGAIALSGCADSLPVPKCEQTGNTGDKHGTPYIVGRCLIGDRAITLWCPAPGYDNDGPCQTTEP